MINITKTDALIVVDVQNDFLPGGALAVPDGDAVIAPINALMAQQPFGQIVATQDWHPADHMSFVAQGGPWPQHCVAGSPGAALASGLNTAPIGLVLRKGRSQPIDSYSGFMDNAGNGDTGLGAWLRAQGITRAFVCGLTLDFCVAATAEDAMKQGFTSIVLGDACRAVLQSSDTVASRLAAAGVSLMVSSDLA